MGVFCKFFWGQKFEYPNIGYMRKYFYDFSVSQHLRLIGQLERIFLTLYFLWHKIGEPYKSVVAFWDSCSLMIFLVPLNDRTTPSIYSLMLIIQLQPRHCFFKCLGILFQHHFMIFLSLISDIKILNLLIYPHVLNVWPRNKITFSIKQDSVIITFSSSALIFELSFDKASLSASKDVQILLIDPLIKEILCCRLTRNLSWF